MNDDNKRNHEIEIPLTETERKKAEVLRDAFGLDSIDDLFRMLIRKKAEESGTVPDYETLAERLEVSDDV